MYNELPYLVCLQTLCPILGYLLFVTARAQRKFRSHQKMTSVDSVGFTITSPTKSYAPSLLLEPKNLDISLRVNIQTETVEASVIVTVLCNNSVGKAIQLNGVGMYFPLR